MVLALGIWMSTITQPIDFECKECKEPLAALELRPQSCLVQIDHLSLQKVTLLNALTIDDRFALSYWLLFGSMALMLSRTTSHPRYAAALAILVLIAATAAAAFDLTENQKLRVFLETAVAPQLFQTLRLYVFWKWLLVYIALTLISVLLLLHRRWVRHLGWLLAISSAIGVSGAFFLQCSLLQAATTSMVIALVLIAPLMTFCPQEFGIVKERKNLERKETENVAKAKNVLRSKPLPPRQMLDLAKSLKDEKEFGYARKILARSRTDPRIHEDADTRFQIVQEHALCTYKDPDLPTDLKLQQAFHILQEIDDPKTSTNQETLGLAGGIFKRKWEFTSRREDLERALYYYQRGYKQGGPAGDQGYTGINAAFVLDLLAAEESEEAKESGFESAVAKERSVKAKQIRTELTHVVPALRKKFENRWWFYATLAEAYFGLGDYGEAKRWIAGGISYSKDWERESTARQLAAIAKLQRATGTIDKSKDDVIRDVLAAVAGNDAGVNSAIRGKVGLTLSGGGFRASLFHIGVLARLAEEDVLRSVEVLSCVSGGAIVGAHYYLELLRIFKEKKDSDITREDYINAVKRTEREFLAGVYKNIRTRIILNPLKSLKMMLSTYSRTNRAGELYEKHLFSRTESTDKEKVKPREFSINTLKAAPKDGPERFNPKNHNWQRRAKVPILVLNATTLNTGHNWHFTSTYMGEPPASINSEVDANYRLRRMYYEDAPEDYHDVRLGTAVGASAAVPGVFEPVVLPNLYSGKTVRLVDGGVHDNQGIGALLEQDCSIMLISDASGQMDVIDQPPASLFNVLIRSDSILQARVRDVEFRELQARKHASQLRSVMFLHLKKDLDADPIDWITCQDPHAASDDARPASKRTIQTTYGILKDIQRPLAAIRTDLDSFCEAEAYALMVSGYRMTENELPDALKSAELPSPEPWRFLEIEPAMKDLQHVGHDSLKRVLEVGSNSAFKIWRLSCGLRIVTALVALILLSYSAYRIYLLWNVPIVFAATVGGLVRSGAVALALVAIGILADLLLGKMGNSFVQAIQIQSTVRRLVYAVAAALAGWLVAGIHILIFDRWFLNRGSLKSVLEGRTPKS